MSFRQTFQWGQMGETAIAYWLRNQGYTVLPAYDKPIDSGKGPRLYMALNTQYDQLVAPDMLVMHGNKQHEKLRWIEAKRKTHFGWYRNFGAWQTGIDRRHYLDYLRVREITGVPVWLLFLHESPIPSASDLAWGSPPTCPTGLFGNEITYLQRHVSQTDGYSKNGYYHSMVYWKVEKLQQLATLDEVLAAQPTPPNEPDDDEFDIAAGF